MGIERSREDTIARLTELPSDQNCVRTVADEPQTRTPSCRTPGFHNSATTHVHLGLGENAHPGLGEDGASSPNPGRAPRVQVRGGKAENAVQNGGCV